MRRLTALPAARRLALAATLLGTAALCTTATAADRLNVVASFSLLADMAENVGGEHVSVTPLIGADSDAHSYSPSPGDVRTLSKADVVVFNGLNFEGWIDRLLETSDYQGPRVTASAGVTPLAFTGHRHHHGNHDDSHDHGSDDPHAWQDMARAQTYVVNIRDGLIEVDAAHEADYRDNAEAYLAEMDATDAEIRDQLAAIDEDTAVITGHASFGYFAEAYGLRFLSPEGLATSAAPSASRMARLVDVIHTENVGALFYENMASPNAVDQLAEDTQLPVAGTLYADALARKGEASTYLGMMRHNARVLHRALADKNRPD